MSENTNTENQTGSESANAAATGEANAGAIGAAGVGAEAVLATLPQTDLPLAGESTAAKKPGASISGAIARVVDSAQAAIEKVKSKRGRKPGPHAADCRCPTCAKKRGTPGQSVALGTPPADSATKTEAVPAEANLAEQALTQYTLADYAGWGETFEDARQGYYDFREFRPLRELATRKFDPETAARARAKLKLPINPVRQEKIKKFGARLGMLLKVPPQGSEFLEGGIAMYMEHMEIRALLDDFRAEFLKRPDYKPENQREEKPLTIVGEE